MLINTQHILTVSKPQETYINPENGIEIKYPNILIRYINKDYTVVFFESMHLAMYGYELLSSKLPKDYLFLEIDMSFTESIFNKENYIKLTKPQKQELINHIKKMF